MNDKLAIAIRVVNFVKTNSVKSSLFTALCKDMDADHETLFFSCGCSMVIKKQYASWGLRAGEGSRAIPRR